MISFFVYVTISLIKNFVVTTNGFGSILLQYWKPKYKSQMREISTFSIQHFSNRFIFNEKIT